MPRARGSKVQRAFAVYADLTAEEQAQYDAMKAGYALAQNPTSTPSPKRTRGPGKPKANGAPADTSRMAAVVTGMNP